MHFHAEATGIGRGRLAGRGRDGVKSGLRREGAYA